MSTGDLTRHFGTDLVSLLADRFADAWPAFDRAQFKGVAKELEDLKLMQRVARIAEALYPCLPVSLDETWEIMAATLPPPLAADEKVFNDGYWMLPLAAYWERYGCPNAESDDESEVARTLALSLGALEELTQRGTAEFAIRRFASTYPDVVFERVGDWRNHPSFHVRRLASEGTRPYLPWGGKLRVAREAQAAYLEAITPLARDSSAYVRRSVGNHVRDWRRIDPLVADGWIETVDPPEDVRRLAMARQARAD